MDKIKEQANAVGQLVFSSETGDLYKRTLTRTWDIIRETALLLWLVVCLTVVGGEWFYRTSVGLGRSARDWYTTFSEKSTATTEAQPLGSTGEALLGMVKSSTSNLISQARKQIGLPAPEPTAPAAATPKPAAPPAAPPAAAPPAAAPSTPPASFSSGFGASTPASPSTDLDADLDDDTL